MAPDFTLPPDLRDLIDGIRAEVEVEALPAEAEIAAAARAARRARSRA